MDLQPPPPGESRSNTGRLAGAKSYAELLGTQQERRHKLVHHDAANAATEHMTQDAHLEIVRKTGSSKTRSSIQLDVHISISRQTAVNLPYNVQRVSIECYITNSSLPVTGNHHG
jgi:type VI protein secretion system component VasA